MALPCHTSIGEHIVLPALEGVIRCTIHAWGLWSVSDQSAMRTRKYTGLVQDREDDACVWECRAINWNTKPSCLFDREDDACVWECRGRQPFAGARGVLASSLLPAAAGGKKGVCTSPE